MKGKLEVGKKYKVRDDLINRESYGGVPYVYTLGRQGSTITIAGHLSENQYSFNEQFGVVTPEMLECEVDPEQAYSLRVTIRKDGNLVETHFYRKQISKPEAERLFWGMTNRFGCDSAFKGHTVTLSLGDETKNLQEVKLTRE